MKPLVVRIGLADIFVWVQRGRGWIHAGDSWQPLDAAPGLGGTVLGTVEVATLVHRLGRPQVTLASERAGREALRARLDAEERANAFGVGVLCKLAFPGDES